MFVLNCCSAQQNLISNGDFEQYIACPTNQGQMSNVYYWGNAGGTPDYMNSCSSNWLVDVPNNVNGFQNARSGNGYIGIVVYASQSTNVREYVATELYFGNLVAGKKYCFTCYVSPSGGAKYSIDALGVFLSPSAMGASCSFCLIDTPAYFVNTTVITDTTNWVKVSGVFTATGSERYLILGNFNTDSATATSIINPQGYPGTYFYIDDVSLYEITEPYAGNDTTLCLGDSVRLGTTAVAGVNYVWKPSLGLSDSTSSNPIAQPNVTTTYTITISDTAIRTCACDSMAEITVTVSACAPNPEFYIPTLLIGQQQFVIPNLPEGTTLTLYDLLGRKVFQQENYQNQFYAHYLSAACYTYELKPPNAERITGKICVIN